MLSDDAVWYGASLSNRNLFTLDITAHSAHTSLLLSTGLALAPQPGMPQPGPAAYPAGMPAPGIPTPGLASSRPGPPGRGRGFAPPGLAQPQPKGPWQSVPQPAAQPAQAPQAVERSRVPTPAVSSTSTEVTRVTPTRGDLSTRFKIPNKILGRSVFFSARKVITNYLPMTFQAIKVVSILYCPYFVIDCEYNYCVVNHFSCIENLLGIPVGCHLSDIRNTYILSTQTHLDTFQSNYISP